MKKASFTLLVLCMANRVHAGTPGTTSANFLKLGVGPRAYAMGEAQVGLADDVYAAYWNPAGLAQLKTQEAGFAHTQLYEDIQSESAAFAFPHSKWGTFAGSLTYLHMGKFEAYDAAGQQAGQVGAYDAAAGLSYARPLFQNKRQSSHISLGFTGRAIKEQLDTVSAQTMAGDFGLFAAPGDQFGEALNGFKGGFAVRNFGRAMKFDRDSFELPRSMSAGLSWNGSWLGEEGVVAVDGEKPSDAPARVGGGVELTTLKILILRCGYRSGGELVQGIRLGAGLRLKSVQVDYAISGAGELGMTHQIGVTLKIGRQAPDPVVLSQTHYQRGMREYRRAHYSEALVEFNKALEMDPSHPQALQKMKETYENIKTATPQ